MRNSKLLIILCLNVALLLLAIWLKPRFQTNDDIGMIYAYSGTAIFDVPTAVTAFSTKSFGLLMTMLYSTLPAGIEGYTLTLFALIFCSSVIVHQKITDNLSPKNPLFWLAIIPVLGFITLNFYLELQFTMVTGLLCFAGVLLVAYQPKKTEVIMAILLFIMACLIRPSVVPIVLFFLFIINFSSTFFIPNLLDSRKQILKRFGLFVAILCSVYFIDKSIHSEKEKQFMEFNVFRAGIVDFGVEKTGSNSIPSNWGKEELLLFKNWFYNDTMLYSRNQDYKLAVSKHNIGYIEKIRVSNISINVILRQFIDPLFRCILLLALVPLFFVKEWKKCLLSLSLVLIAYIILYNILTILFKEPPFRVSFMLFTTGILFHLSLTLKLIGNEDINKIRLFIPALFIIYGLYITKISLVYRYQDIAETRCQENYRKDLMVIRWSGYPFELVDPFKVSQGLKDIKIVSMGAFSVHPAVHNSFGSFKYNNLTSDIIGKENLISFMMPEDISIWEEFKSAYIAFIAKHYKRTVFFEKVANSSHCFGFSEFKLKEIANAELD